MGERVAIRGTGSYLPGEPVPSERLTEVLGQVPGLSERVAVTSDRLGGMVLARTGVTQRYYAIDPATRRQTETNATMAEKAARRALDMAGVAPESIDLLILATPMADYVCPPTSAILQGRLGIEQCTEIEIHSNCTGTPKGIQIALEMLASGRYRRALVTYAQLSSVFLRAEFFNPERVEVENLALRWILSDGAGALVLERGDDGMELIDAHVESIGGFEEAGMQGMSLGGFGEKDQAEMEKILPYLYAHGHHHITQNIGRVSRLAPRHLIDGLANMLKHAGIAGSSVAEFVLGIPGKHFVTPDMIAYFEKAVGAPWEGHHDYSSVEDFGYCGGATMLVQFDRLVRSGRLSPGTLVAAYLEESSKWMSGGFLARA